MSKTTKVKFPSWKEMVTFTCSFCLFTSGSSQLICKASLTFNVKGEAALSVTRKQLLSHKFLQVLFSNKCFIMFDFLSGTKCSLSLLLGDALFRQCNRIDIQHIHIYKQQKSQCIG